MRRRAAAAAAVAAALLAVAATRLARAEVTELGPGGHFSTDAAGVNNPGVIDLNTGGVEGEEGEEGGAQPEPGLSQPFNASLVEVIDLEWGSDFAAASGNITLRGSLVVARGAAEAGAPLPGALLVQGVSATNRWTELLPGFPLVQRDVAEALALAGWAVLSFDSRLCTFGSTHRYGCQYRRCNGNSLKVNTSDGCVDTPRLRIQDFVADAKAGLMALAGHPLVEPRRLAVVSHSHGGFFAPLVAGEMRKLAALDDEIDLVMLSGTGLSIDQEWEESAIAGLERIDRLRALFGAKEERGEVLTQQEREALDWARAMRNTSACGVDYVKESVGQFRRGELSDDDQVCGMGGLVTRKGETTCQGVVCSSVGFFKEWHRLTSPASRLEQLRAVRGRIVAINSWSDLNSMEVGFQTLYDQIANVSSYDAWLVPNDEPPQVAVSMHLLQGLTHWLSEADHLGNSIEPHVSRRVLDAITRELRTSRRPGGVAAAPAAGQCVEAADAMGESDMELAFPPLPAAALAAASPPPPPAGRGDVEEQTPRGDGDGDGDNDNGEGSRHPALVPVLAVSGALNAAFLAAALAVWARRRWSSGRHFVRHENAAAVELSANPNPFR